MSARPRRLTSLVLLVLLCLCTSISAHAGTVTVFAASSLTDALADIGQAYEKASGNHVQFSFASSSSLARQIAEGAPADVYVSADQRWMDYVQKHGRIRTDSRTNLLANQLVLVAPASSPLESVDIHAGFDLVRLLGAGRLAMGNPMHVPAGIYGKQALQSLHVWQSVKGHVARSANVRAALALVALGEAPLGIVYRTDALASNKVKIVGTFPASTHPPVIYPTALTVRANTAARSFLQFLQSTAAARIFKRYGFTLIPTPP